MKQLLKDVSPGSIVFTSERMEDEIRETFYIRDADRECRYDYNVPVGRFGMVQGDPRSGAPRIVRMSGTACRDPGEADGRTPCVDLEQSLFKIFLAKALLAQAKEKTNV